MKMEINKLEMKTKTTEKGRNLGAYLLINGEHEVYIPGIVFKDGQIISLFDKKYRLGVKKITTKESESVYVVYYNIDRIDNFVLNIDNYVLDGVEW